MKPNVLKSKIKLHDMTYDELLNELQNAGVSISKASWYRKLSGRIEFNRDEIEGLINVLSLTPDETVEIFFDLKVS